jgi:energy-coupling factor transport system ATP-binding protein
MGRGGNPAAIQHMKDLASFINSNQGKPVLLEGQNFSGRTALLRRWVGEWSRLGGRAIYVGPSVQQSISSLVPTVRSELQLHLTGSRHGEALLHLAESFGLGRCFDQSPFTLSGGEQTLLVALCKLGLEPALLGFDGAMEELDRQNAGRLAEVFSSPAAERAATILTMNGYAEDRPLDLATRVQVSDLTPGAGGRAPLFDACQFRFTAPNEAGCLEAEGISFSYTPGSPVLRNISLRLEPGHIFSLEGRNGAGKSTLARILVGVLPLQRGWIAFNGRAINPWKTPGQIAVMHMQNPDVQLFADTVAAEVADLPACSSGAAASMAGVLDMMTEHPFDLPFVLRKRLTFSTVAHLSRPWFIFDEPTLGQDAAACDQMVAVLQRIAEGGAGVIVISHSREFIRRVKAQSLRLENGCLNKPGTTTS